MGNKRVEMELVGDLAADASRGSGGDSAPTVFHRRSSSSRNRSHLTDDETCNRYLMCWGCLGNRICCEAAENNWQTGVCCCCASLDVNGLADACCCVLTLCSPWASYLPLWVRLNAWHCGGKGTPFNTWGPWLGCLILCGPCAACDELTADRFELTDFPPEDGSYSTRSALRQGVTWVRNTPDGWTLINSGQIPGAILCAGRGAEQAADRCVVGCCAPCWPSLAGSQMHREARLRGIIRHHWAVLACARVLCCAAGPQQLLTDADGWPQLTPFDSEYEGTCCSFFRGQSTVVPEEPVQQTAVDQTPAVTNIKTRFPTLSHQLIQHALDGFDEDAVKAVDWLEKTLALHDICIDDSVHTRLAAMSPEDRAAALAAMRSNGDRAAALAPSKWNCPKCYTVGIEVLNCPKCGTQQ